MSAALDRNLLGTHAFPARARPLLDPVARARDVVPILLEESPRIEAAGRLTDRVVDALHERGLYRALLPKDFGGDELHPAEFVRMQMTLAAADASTAWCIGQASGCSMSAAYLRPEIAEEIWGSDPRAVLAWGFQLSGTAKVVPGGYRVTGKWAFGSGGRHSTWMGCHCQVEDADGTLRKNADGSLFERTMIVPHDQVGWTAAWNVVGLRGTSSDTYTLNDVFVPEEHSVTRDTDQERRQAGPLYQFTTTNMYSSGFAGVSMGIARGMLDDFRTLALKKSQANTPRPLRDSPVIQHMLAENEAKLGAARAYLLEVLRDAWDDVAASGRMSHHHRMMIRLATTSAIHRAQEVAEFAYHEAGSTAIFHGNPFERRMRDIHASAQQVQGRTEHIEAVGRYFMGHEAAGRYL